MNYLKNPNNPIGSFIVRKSENSTNDPNHVYTLCLLYKRDIVRNFRINRNKNGYYYIYESNTFKSLTGLIDFYKSKSNTELLKYFISIY
jgi:hypothetical protein